MFPDLWGAITWFVTLPGVAAIVGVITALATALSVIAALVISRRAEYHQITRDRIESDARLERRAERQAVMIRVTDTRADDLEWRGEEEQTEVLYGILVQNFSEKPIFHVTAVVNVNDHKIAQGYREYWSHEQNVTVAPGDRKVVTVTVAPPPEHDYMAFVGSRFLDAFGDSWRTDSHGHLAQTNERIVVRDLEPHD